MQAEVAPLKTPVAEKQQKRKQRRLQVQRKEVQVHRRQSYVTIMFTTRQWCTVTIKT